MQTIEVAPRDWTRTLDNFSTVHEGWLVSLDLVGPALGAQPQIREVPLIGVTAETGVPNPSITIAAGRAGAAQITHVISAPSHVRLERTDDGADVALEIESNDGVAAILRFRASVRPEIVDGLPPRR